MSVDVTRDAFRKDIPILFATRILRLFAYGSFSVILALYLAAAGLTESEIGLLLTLTLVGDTIISLFITTRADRVGRKRMLMIGAGLMIFAGLVFAATNSFWLLLLAATVGVISPSGNEVGPFLAIEQAALSEEITSERRTKIFAWYNLVGSFATALGALLGGGLVQVMHWRGFEALASYRAVALGYSVVGGAMVLLFSRLTSAAEPPMAQRVTGKLSFTQAKLGLGESKNNVFKLAGLFTIDAFAGGFVVQAFVAYWFYKRFGVNPAMLGGIFFGANVLAGISALSANWIASKIGLLATMVGTHIPSNILLLLVPLMPNLPLAIMMLLLRFSISQMDVPTRQAYTMALVTPAERSAAAGVTGIARTVGAAISPLVAGPLFATAALASIPFLLAGGLKIVYDLLVWQTFRNVKLPKA